MDNMPDKRPSFNEWAVCEEAAKLASDVTQKLSPDRSFSGVRVQQVFELLGLKESTFAELPEEVKKKLVDTVKQYHAFGRYAIPCEDSLAGNVPWPETVQLATNEDHSTIYFYSDDPEYNLGHINWSWFRDWGNGYELQVVNHNSLNSKMVHRIACREAQVKVAAQTRDDASEITG